MTHADCRTRVFLLGNAAKPVVAPAFERLSAWLDRRGVLVGSDVQDRPELILDARPDLVVVLGGDGTILSTVRAMRDEQLPIVGVNLGKLGYLADFTVDELERHFDRITQDPGLINGRMMLDVEIVDPDGSTWSGLAVNDCVVRAGAPFRTVGLSISIGDHPLTTVMGDGLIVATPTGSTAHNLSCGGPILEPHLDAFILTPMAPHSLSHRPVVLDSDTSIHVTAAETNDGTTAVLDGQTVRPLPAQARISIRRAAARFRHVRNPEHNGWDTMINKLKWGQNPGG